MHVPSRRLNVASPAHASHWLSSCVNMSSTEPTPFFSQLASCRCLLTSISDGPACSLRCNVLCKSTACVPLFSPALLPSTQSLQVYRPSPDYKLVTTGWHQVETCSPPLLEEEEEEEQEEDKEEAAQGTLLHVGYFGACQPRAVRREGSGRVRSPVLYTKS